MWIPTEHLQNFQYPNVKTTREGQRINNTNTTGGACWYYALIGNLDSNADITVKRYDDIIDKISKKKRDIADEFDGMVDSWEQKLPRASTVAKNELNSQANLVQNKEQKFDWIVADESLEDDNEKKYLKKPKYTYDQKAFTNSMLKVIVEDAGFIIVDDDQFQIHMRTFYFYSFDHWGISFKMANGKRNYVQKTNRSDLYINCNVIWDEYFGDDSLFTINVQSFNEKQIEAINKLT